MFKKIILVIISLAAAGTLGYFLSNLVHDKATSPESLPENVLSFIPQQKVIAFKMLDFPDALGPKRPMDFKTFVPFQSMTL